MRYCLLLLIAFLGTRCEAQTLRAGASAADITPLQLPVSMTGSFQDRKATGVHDRLHARSLVLDDGDTRIAFVIVDSCLIPREIYDAAKESAAKETGIPTSRMLTAATHTHTAPTALKAAQCTPNPEYIEHLTKQIAAAVVEANERLRSVEIGWGVVAVPGEVGNRRWFVKPEAMKPNPFGRLDDKVKMNPPRGTGLLIRAAGPVDPDVNFISVRSKSGAAMSVLANYGLHYVGGISAGQLSADYFGEFSRQIGDRLNGDDSFVGIMSNGTSGDVNNYQFPNPRPRAAPYERMEAVASKVADRVQQAHEDVRFTDNASIRMNEREIELGVRKPDAAELERAHELFKNADDPLRLNMDELYAQETIRLRDAESTVRMKLQAITINDLAIVAIPCEVFAEIGLEIKRRSPFKTTFVIELANGYNGYLPTPGQHALGGYETWRSGWSYLETEASTTITETTLEMLKSLRADVQE
ncbi:MAG: neutral/alkaline non-lysosomal ceramidase N-terminal domain-containing protein [Planctomycetes bacterium]|nr:neutral/alkaline non-lysosomal ceramidase N-terminal domain-containing protein [Planctomycetota bacterium]